MDRNVVVVLTLATLVSGCGLMDKLKGNKGDAAPEAAPADTAEAAAPADDAGAAAPEDSGAPAGPTFANDKDVKRFPDETALEPDVYAVEWPTVTPKTEPGAGAVVATVAKGTKCTLVARKGQTVLATFPDPKDAAKTLGGWFPESAFVAGTAPPPAALNLDGGVKKVTGVCPAGLTLLIDADAFCGKTCKVDKDCASLGANIVCAGQAKPITATGVGEPVSTCVKKSATATTAKPDAGAAPPPAADSGAGTTPTTTTSGTAPPPPPPAPDAGATVAPPPATGDGGIRRVLRR